LDLGESTQSNTQHIGSVVASRPMLGSEVTLRERLQSILTSDLFEVDKHFEVNRLVRYLNDGASKLEVSETNEIVNQVATQSEYATSQLTPKPGNIVLEDALNTTSSISSWNQTCETSPTNI
jgi:hypothetical protein